jgi:L,D-transpeptidase catalytic domain
MGIWRVSALALVVACTESKGAVSGPQPLASASAGPSSDGGVTAIADASSYPLIGALNMQSPIMSEMDFPTKELDERRRHGKDLDKGVHRIGYLRRGAKVAVLPQAHVTDNCKEGWYELVSGGFICGRYASLDLNHPRVTTGPHAPNLDQPLPYQYAFNIANGTPLYRTVPAQKDRVQYEPWLVHKPKPKIEDSNPYDNYDAGSSAEPAGSGLGAAFAGDAEDAGVPWYLRDWDGGKPQITLDDLREDGGPIMRRMVKGFYVALDTDIEVKHIKWWKTTAGYLAPYDRMVIAKQPTDFHGVWLNTASPPDYPPAVAQADGGVPPYWVDKPPTHLPVAFVTWPHSHKYNVSDDHKKSTLTTDTLSRFTPLQLTGTSERVNGVLMHEVEGGFWIRDDNVIVMKPGPAPTDLKPGEKWIDVNLDNQSLVAYEGDKAVYATLVSTGRVDDHEKEKDHRTPPGSFRIREKHVAATMDGDVASDGPYSIEDVPWIMYFNQSYALHGAFWHANFGHVQSHGCVNLAPDDARAMFGWTEPQLPTGWHAVWATAEHPGTRVVVHTEKPPPHWDTE